MEEQARRNFAAALTVFCGIAYFFVFARPLPKALDLTPVWSNPVDAGSWQAIPGASPKDLLPFTVGSTYGYFERDRGVALVAERTFGLSMASDMYAAYDRLPEGVTWRDPAGRALFVTREIGYPFMEGGRRFIIGPDQATVSEIGLGGETLWRLSFPSILTAFDASPSLALFGTLDGHLIGVAPDGSERLSFVPGGSRIECVMGCAVSPDGRTIAAIAGIDRQRLVVLEKREEAFRVAYHRWLDSDYRRPARMAFTPDGGELLFESPGGLGIYEVGARKEYILPSDSPVGIGSAISGRKMLLIVENGTRQSLMASAPDGRREFTYSFSGKDAMLKSDGDSVFLGLRHPEGISLLRMDFGEE